MKKLLLQCLLLGLWSVVTGMPAFAQNSIAVNCVGVPYMNAIYKELAGDFPALKKTFLLNYTNEKMDGVIRQISNNKADFAVSDIALSRREQDERKLIQISSMVTAIVPVINIPGVKSNQLILTGEVLANIMAGEIANWDHESIRALNPGIHLPSLPIKRIVRADASGATLAITTYLAKNSASFRKEIGSAVSVKWPNTFRAVDSADALADAVTSTPGALSYIEMDLGNIKKLSFVRLKHHTGAIVKADIDFLRSGVVGARAMDGLTAVDLGQNWPILLPIYIVIPKTAMNDEKMRTALRFFYWTFGKADEIIEQYGLVPLPVTLQVQAVKVFRNVQSVNGGALGISFDM